MNYTYEEIKRATQAVLNAAWIHIHAQGEPSVKVSSLDSGFVCRYRNPKGLGCAFAPAIKDYNPEMEGTPAGVLLKCHPAQLHTWARACNTGIAGRIQQAHDEAAVNFPETFLLTFQSRIQRIINDNHLDLIHPADSIKE